jgi:hypothetical protein
MHITSRNNYPANSSELLIDHRVGGSAAFGARPLARLAAIFSRSVLQRVVSGRVMFHRRRECCSSLSRASLPRDCLPKGEKLRLALVPQRE